MAQQRENLTYGHQDSLPPLPLPALADTMERYLESVRPFLSEQELEHTTAVVADFQQGVGAQLQAQLEERASNERNWVEDWWLQFGYMMPRYPSAVNVNWHGVLPGRWGSGDMSQAEVAAIFAESLCEFRRALLEGTFPAEEMGGQKLCMHTYSLMFNSCVIPGEGMDHIETCDTTYRHIAVLRNDAIWVFDVLDEAGNTLPLIDLVAQFEAVRHEATGLFDLDRNPPVSVLTTENRDTWAAARDHIREISPEKNCESLELIETALFCITLEETSPTSDREIANHCLYHARNKWFDKPFNLVLFENTTGGLNGQHAWADAIVVVRTFDWCIKRINATFRDRFHGRTASTANLQPPRRLLWELDTRSYTAIESASSHMAQLGATGDLNCLKFVHYGKGFLKRYRQLPDLYVQQAIQLAYYKLKGTNAAVYESAHTRIFYHGRTETIRSCTEESVAFCQAMSSDRASDGDKWSALQAAMAKHKEVAGRSLTGQGIDRHLMGLQIVSEMSGLSPKPAFFTDKAFIVSKTYTLSTSNISGGGDASPIWGGFSAMTTDGYGVCYCILNERIEFSVSAYKGNPHDTEAFKHALEMALIEMRELCLTRNVAYLAESKL